MNKILKEHNIDILIIDSFKDIQEMKITLDLNKFKKLNDLDFINIS